MINIKLQLRLIYTFHVAMSFILQNWSLALNVSEQGGNSLRITKNVSQNFNKRK